MTNDDLLRQSLSHISDQAAPTDLLAGALTRSRRIGRNRALAGAGATLAVAALVGGLALQFKAPNQTVPPLTPPTITTAATATPTTAPPTTAPPTSAEPAAQSINGLPGFVYARRGDELYRLEPSGPRLITPFGGENANVSPDGTRIVYIDHNGSVVVADRDNRNQRTVLRGAADMGYEPVWSPDNNRLIAAKASINGAPTPGIITVATGTFTPLPTQIRGVHYLWSANGRIAFATGECQIRTANPDGTDVRTVPAPANRRNCSAFSISPDGAMIAVRQRATGEPAGDIARDFTANTLVDTHTGNAIDLPVAGKLNAVLFRPDGKILVRSDVTRLTLLDSNRKVITTKTIPEATGNLIAYTPR
jgi:TolB protein